ncbi:DUF1499 domain-containing protein [Rhizobium sp. TRM95111]|uniref:DUF1499 domain-containing protein n=1 Tax=Rhizobium alarense TaxID=2846851 RepID=UPI001F29DA21|nr:DUF1499 domain-containing protein [Rhizobium alarense]MCF3640116.1 DUF1499 domain-containing protein [Rhizobium alarense]
MTIEYVRPTSHAAYWSRRLAYFALLLFLFATLSHRFGPLTTPHFLALVLFAAVLSLLAVALAAVGIARLWQVGARGGRAAFVAVLAAVAPLVAAGAGAFAFFDRPAIYDVTTDRAAPPPWLQEPVAKQDWLPRAGSVTVQDRTAQSRAYAGLTGRRYDGALDRVLVGARKVAEENGIAIIRESGLENVVADLEDMAIDPKAEKPEDDGLGAVPVPVARPLETVLTPRIGGPGDVLLQGEWRSLVFGFRFDLVIRLREEAETTLVDLRVASRYGQHDLGIGAAFAERYLKALDAELLGIAGD